MFRHILVLLNGLPGAERAIPVAASLARHHQGSLVFLCGVAPATAFKSSAASLPKAESSGATAGSSEQTCSLSRKSEKLRQTEAIEQVMLGPASYLALLPGRYANELMGLTTEAHLAFVTTVPTLPPSIHLEQINLIVLCRPQKGESGQGSLEQVAQQIMHHCSIPLLILHEHERMMPVLDGTHALRVVVPLDGTLFAETALGPALRLLSQGAAFGQRELCLLHVVDLFAGDGTGDEETHRSPYTTIQARQTAWRYLQMVINHLRSRDDCPSDVCITSRVTSGVDIASTISAQRVQTTEKKADEFEAESPIVPSVVVIATHRREGPQRSLQGSIAERLLETTTAPVMTVCPGVVQSRLINFALPAGGRN